MVIPPFPDPRTANHDGLVAIGGDLSIPTLLAAYRSGIFPWPDPDYPDILWASPIERGVLEFASLHIPRSLRKERERTTWRFTVDTAFEHVIDACAEATVQTGRDLTWIVPAMRRAYIDFHRAGHAHSVEVWEGEELVGGLYGVAVDGIYAGESMFHRRPNASKLALLHLIDHLRARGAEWIDIQMLTPHMATLGARGVPRDEFLTMLERGRNPERILFAPRAASE